MAEPQTFEGISSKVQALLGDVEYELRSEWYDGAGVDVEQAEALMEARGAIAQAKAAIDRAGAP